MTEAAVKLAEAYGIIRTVAYVIHAEDYDGFAELLDNAADLLEEVRGEIE